MRIIVTAQEMRQLDAITIEEIGLPGVVLMENAGRAVAAAVLEELARSDGGAGRVAVVCGAGNNGGDGYVAARCLREAGLSATVYLAAPRASIRGDAALHLGVLEQVGGLALSVADPETLAEHRDAIEAADVVVDGVFGTGLARDVEGHYCAVLATINRCRGRRLAVDVPSGLSADTGQILGLAVAPHRTVTLAFLKVGLALAPGFARCGQVTVADIGIPRHLAQAQGIRCAMLEAGDVALHLPRVDPLTHKTRRGHVLVIAGSPGKRGAARLTSWAALRAGAGMVTLAAGAGGVEIAAPDPIMTAELDDGADAVATLDELAAGKRAVALGPGMATGAGGRALVHAALAELSVPLVVDADGLNHIGAELDLVATSRPPVVLTPHPGEAARMLGQSAAAVEADRLAAVRALAERTRAVVVLKGARTLVCDGVAGDGFVSVNPTGGPALATAGSGDVLTGIIAGLLAQGVAPEAAARLGVYLHGSAADQAAARLGVRSVTAADLAEHLPAAIASLEAAGGPAV